MEFYVASKGYIPGTDLEIFGKIRSVLDTLPDILFDPAEQGWGACKNQFTCHLICRALTQYFRVAVHDGYFLHSYQHSWLVPYSNSSIIDAYPVAGAVPFIVANDPAAPWSRLYKKSSQLQQKFETDEFLDRLGHTTRAVGTTIQQLGFA